MANASHWTNYMSLNGTVSYRWRIPASGIACGKYEIEARNSDAGSVARKVADLKTGCTASSTTKKFFVSAGVFRSDLGARGKGGVYYSNGSSYCWYTSPSQLKRLTGITNIASIRPVTRKFDNRYDGACK